MASARNIWKLHKYSSIALLPFIAYLLISILRFSRLSYEQILLENKANFITSKNREKIIKHAIKLDHELIIFDDGLQERRFDYDIKFVCFEIFCNRIHEKLGRKQNIY